MQSDLVGLRAELHKKRVEASKYGSGQKGLPKKPGGKQSKSTSFNIRNAGLAARDARDRQQLEEETPSDETARAILEKKAKMYERLHGGIETLEDDALNDKYLVNFQRKIVDEVAERKRQKEREKDVKAEQREREELDPEKYKASAQDEEWVEYTDVLGRTRECMRKDLPTMVDQDKNLLGENSDEEAKEAEISGEKYRERLHQKWESEAELNAFKKDMHYQDVSYDEARMHGTGYMRFSQDEKERKAQMTMLKEMHEEASKSEHTKKVAASKKQKLLQARLEKVRQRKRLKLGLPIKDDDKLRTPPPSDDEEEPVEPSVTIYPEVTPLENIDKIQPKKSKTREWDVGKVGLKGAEGVGPISQEAWVDSQRNQRNQDFAPPTLYDSKKQYKSQRYPSKSHQESTGYDSNCHHQPSTSHHESANYEDVNEDRGENRRSDFAPPATYEYYGPSNFSKRRNTKPSYDSMKSAIDKGLNHFRNMSN